MGGEKGGLTVKKGFRDIIPIVKNRMENELEHEVETWIL